MGLDDRLQEHIDENKRGMLYDVLFAVVWVTFISMLFEFVFLTAPTWAYYMFMLAGVPAYFGFFWSLRVARAQQES